MASVGNSAAFFGAASWPVSGYGHPVKQTMGEAESLAGRILADKYLLTARLGEGGFGSIWRAEHLVLKSPVAVKLIDLDIARKDGAVERFLREAQATAALRSPHVVQVLDYGVDGDQPFIVMELLEGENLAERLEREKRLSPLETIRIVTHVARAIGKAHELGIVHRDLKPENIFIVHTGDEEVVKVLDFGVAKFATAPELNRNTYTKTGTLIGTPYYMSPEQAQGNKTVDSRSDLWALGVITFEMMTGQRPFDGDALGDLVLTICVRSISVPSAIAPVPEGFDAWFAKAVERDPAARFQTAREMALALLKVVEAESVDGISLGLDERSNLPPAASSSDAGVDIPSRPIASAFATTVRDESPALGALTGSSLIAHGSASPAANTAPPPDLQRAAAASAIPPGAVTSALPAGTSAFTNAGGFGTNAVAGPLPSTFEDPVDAEEHLPPWAVVGIALLALMAGASIVYGVFFLARAYDVSNAPLDETGTTPTAVSSSEGRSSKARLDVIATGKPNTAPETPPARAPRNAAAPGANSNPPANRSSATSSIGSGAPAITATPGNAVPAQPPTVQSTVVPSSALEPAAPPADLTPEVPLAPAQEPRPALTSELLPVPPTIPSVEPQQAGVQDPAPPYEKP